MTTQIGVCAFCGIERQTNHSRDVDTCRDCNRHPKQPIPRADWIEQAACRNYYRDAWYGETQMLIEYAKNICHTCPVMNDCLDFALRNDERHGVWGGLSANQRMKLTRTRAI
jgi:hypothetical protein